MDGSEIFTVRFAAEDVLVSFGADAVPPLLHLAETADDTTARRHAIRALGRIRPTEALALLRVLVDNEDWRFQHTISTLAARMSLEYDVLISPRVIGQERWQNMEQHGFGLYEAIATEGIPLDPTMAAY